MLSPRAGGRLVLADVQDMLSQRRHLPPPLRRRLAECRRALEELEQTVGASAVQGRENQCPG